MEDARRVKFKKKYIYRKPFINRDWEDCIFWEDFYDEAKRYLKSKVPYSWVKECLFKQLGKTVALDILTEIIQEQRPKKKKVIIKRASYYYGEPPMNKKKRYGKSTKNRAS